MVSVAARPGTRDRILSAAAQAFATRGFDGAKVDAIAARAGVNKAMLYYHFRSKAGLYRAILLDMFTAVADAVARVRDARQPPEAQIRAFIEAVVAQAAARPHFPPIWLRELAEGGRHIDEEIVTAIRRVLGTLTDIVRDGHRRRVFAPAHPFVVQVGIIAPVLFFAASRPVRDRFAHLMPATAAAPTIQDVIEHVYASTVSALTPARAAIARQTSRRSRR
jgi:TetR/AcrR family transcriptional regulator